MTDSLYPLFLMGASYRESLIAQHEFFVAQARKRLLSQFADISQEADKAAEEWLERPNQYFDPENDDVASYYEEANETGIEFYRLLTDMREQIRLAVLAAVFHEWEKSLRGWLAGEARHWSGRDKAYSAIWKANFPVIMDLLATFGWDVRSKSYFKSLDACRCVVNVYKHGEGTSLSDLRESYPEYLTHRSNATEPGDEIHQVINYDDLGLTDEHLQRFSDAIVAFWRDVPDQIYNDVEFELPSWFEKAVEADQITLRKLAEKPWSQY